ncbi:MAG: hypothetical protein EOP48_07130, partial [Sphingobacteriales bacterium]
MLQYILQWFSEKTTYLRNLFETSPGEAITIIGFLAASIAGIYKGIKTVLKFFKSRSSDRDLHPFFRHDDIDFLTKKYVTHKFSHISPNSFKDVRELAASLNASNTTSYNQFYHDLADENSPTRFFAILGDSGIGKSTLIAKIFDRYHSKIFRQFKIKIIPLGHPYAIKELGKLESEADKIILCLDGLDEFESGQESSEVM